MDSKLVIAAGSLCAGLILSTQALADTFYVAAGGSSGNSGLSSASPLGTLAQAKAKAGSGDSILLKRGDVFRESASFGSGITFGAYGDSSLARPSVRGSDLVNNWTLHNGNIYVANVSADVGYVYVNQQQATLARFPNEGWLRTLNFTETSGGLNTVVTSTGVTSNSHNADDYWNGANIRWRRHSWWFETRTVTDYTAAGALSLGDKSIIPVSQADKSGWGFYLDNKLEELDAPGEYYYDKAAGKLYLMAPNGANPNGLTVEVSVRDQGIAINGGAVTDIEFAQQKTVGLQVNGQATVSNSRFTSIGSDAGGAGISGTWNAAGSQIRDNAFDNNLNVAINWNQNPAVSTATVIERNQLNQTGTVAGYGGEGSWKAAGIVVSNGTNIQIQKNRINGTGYAGIIIGDDGNTVQYNVIDNAMSTLNDGAGIYVNASSTTIRNNIIRNARGGMESSGNWENLSHGIWPEYLSNFHSQLIENNTVINAGGFGVYFENNYDSTVQGNVLWGSDRSQIDLSGNGTAENHIVTANVFVATSAGEALVRFRHNTNYGSADGNYYLDLADAASVVPFDKNWQPWSAITLAQWQQQYGWADGAPIVWDPGTLSDFSPELFVNETGSPLQIDLRGSWLDLDGLPVTGLFQLAPYSSRVLIAVPEPASMALAGLLLTTLVRRRR